MPPQIADPVADYLRTVQTSDIVRASAWDAVHDATDDADLTKRLQRVPVPNDVRAQLFDLSPHATATATPLPAAATEGMLPQDRQPEPTISADGYFEELSGNQGMRWHPPAGSGDELHRPDNSLLGVPPELAVTGAVGVGRAMMGPGTGPGAASRLYAGAKEVVTQTAPAIKYEVVKSSLEAAGVPAPVAAAAAIAVSGYRHGGGKAAAGTAAATTEAGAVETAATTPRAPTAAASVDPVAASPVAPAPPAATGARTAAPSPTAGPQSWGPQRIRNEVGLEARRAKLTLSSEQLDQADALVATGMAPPAAVRNIAAKAAQAPAKLKLNLEESKAYTALLRGGTSHDDAEQAIVAMRALAKRFQTPSTETVIEKVVDRNVTGRWQPK